MDLPPCTQDEFGNFTYEFPNGIILRISQIIEDRDGTHGKTSILKKTPEVTYTLIAPTRCHFESASSKDAISRLAKSHVPNIEWRKIIERVAADLYDKLRSKERVIDLSQVEVQREGWLFKPFITEGPHATILYSIGGTGKSTVAVAILISLLTSRGDIIGIPPRRKANGIYLDWESSEQEMARIAKRILAAKNISVRVPYVKCRGPIQHQASFIASLIEQERAEFIIIDSVGLACGGDLNSTEVPFSLFETVSRLNVPALCIHHPPKSSDTPYGSIYFWNTARSVIELKKERQENHGMVLKAVHRKCNIGPLEPDIDISVTFEKERILISRTTGVEDNATEIIADEIRGNGGLTVEELSIRTGFSPDRIRLALMEGDFTFFEEDGVRRWIAKS